MFSALIKAGAIAFVVGFALAGPTSVYATDDDTENKAVEESMSPDGMAPGPTSEEAQPSGQAAPMESETPSGDDPEEKAIDEGLGQNE